jgi:uncharacterized MAPEG superfamily protein
MMSVDLVAALAVLQFLTFTILTGKARGKYGVKAPAITGHEGFERMYRVQMNTLELLIAFLPSLFLAAKYWSPVVMAGVGAVYLVGRVLYAVAYVNNPPSRGLGFVLSILPATFLAIAGAVGAGMGLVG